MNPLIIQIADLFFFFFLNNTAPPEISPLPLHAALPICRLRSPRNSSQLGTAAPFTATSRSPLCNPALPHTLAGLLISKLSAFSPGGCHAETRRSAAGRDRKSTRLNSSH